jgi:hypothetical protein
MNSSRRLISSRSAFLFFGGTGLGFAFGAEETGGAATAGCEGAGDCWGAPALVFGVAAGAGAVKEGSTMTNDDLGGAVTTGAVRVFLTGFAG